MQFVSNGPRSLNRSVHLQWYVLHSAKSAISDPLSQTIDYWTDLTKFSEMVDIPIIDVMSKSVVMSLAYDE